MVQLPSSWIGYTLNGRYHIESLLGRGGMSTVYRATDPNLQRTVAVKIIHPHLTENPQFIQRFEQEATAVAHLRHPNIVQVHDFDHENGIYYMVMEYIPGETLAQKLQTLRDEHSHMLPAQCIRLLTDLCLAVDYAHQRGMVHRDLKPANVMVNRLGAPVLMDFGIAKLLGRVPESDDQEALGTARYMSPEQIQGHDVDHRADIYALGVMLYEMLIGEPPFTGGSSAEIMAKHLNEPVPGMKGRLTAVPDALTSIVLTAMAKDPDHRYQSATEMATALQSIGLEIQKSTGPLGERQWEHLSRLLQQAETALANHDDLDCLEKLEELERTGADFAPEQVTRLRQAAQTRLYEQALGLFQAGRFDDSQALVGQLHNLNQDWPHLAHLETQIRQAQKTASLQASLDQQYDEAVAALERADYPAALAAWQVIESQRDQLAYTDRLQVARQARAGLCADLYAQAQTAVSAHDPQTALDFWAQIQAIDPDYPDGNGVIDQAQRQQQQRQQQTTWQRRLIYAVPLVVICLLGGFWLARGRPDSSPATPTATVMAAVLQPTATATTIPSPTPTAVPATATAIPSRTPTAVPPTATAVPPTAAPTDLPPDVALAKEDASIFASPQANSLELAVVAAGEEVQVLGRAEVRNWLFVGNGDVAGFIFQPLLQWTGDPSELPVFTYTDAAPEEATPPSGSSVVTPLQIDLWTLPDTVQCRDGRWSQRVFIQGQGGNGRYRYYWQDQLLTGPTTGSYSFTVNSNGGVAIGVGRVVSGDGQVAERELFIPIPACPAEP